MQPVVEQVPILNRQGNESNDDVEMKVMGDTLNANNQPESVESDQVTKKTFICLWLGIVFYVLDVGSDINLAYKYILEGKTFFFFLTIVFVWAPAIISMIVSWRMEKQYERYYNKRFPASIWKQNAWIKVPMFLLLLSPLLYSFNSIRYSGKSQYYEKKGKKDRQQRYYDKMTCEDEESVLFKIFEAFFEAAPQQTLQLSIILNNPDFPSSMQIFCLCTSFFSMALTVTSYHRCNRLAQKDKSNIGIPGLIFQVLWHICITVSRIIAISILASQWPIYTICACFVHWFFMTLWLIVEPLGITRFCGNLDLDPGEPLTLKERIRSWLFAAVLGFVYIFTHLNPGENKTLLRHLFYFPLCGVENLAAVLIWVKISDQSVKNCWYFEVLIILIIVTFILGTISMIIYYKYFHPSLNKKDSPSQGISTPVNCSCQAYGCLSAFVLCHSF